MTALLSSVGNAAVHRSPTLSHAVQKMLVTSVETFPNAYLGAVHVSDLPRLLMKRQPSDWIIPRSSASGHRTASSCCHSASQILLVCFIPGPCCGKRQGHALE